MRGCGERHRFVCNGIDDSAEQRCGRFEAGAGQVTATVEIEAAIDLDLDRVDIRRRIGMASVRWELRSMPLALRPIVRRY